VVGGGRPTLCACAAHAASLVHHACAVTQAAVAPTGHLPIFTNFITRRDQKVGAAMQWMIIALGLLASRYEAVLPGASAFVFEDEPTSSSLDLLDEAHVLYVDVAAPPEPSASEQRLQRLREQWFTNPVHELAESEFAELALDPQRPYWLAVLFTSDTPGCIAAEEEFVAAARAYWSTLERRRNVTSSTLFFAHAALKHAAGVFRAHKVAKVPALLLLPPYDARAAENTPFPAEWWREHNHPLRFAPWIAQEAGVEIPTQSVLGNSDFESYVQLGFLGQIVLVALLNVRRFQTKQGWMYLTGIVYTLSVSGMIFCLLRGSPPFGLSQQHGLLFLYPDKQSQFLLEGLFIGAITAASGAVLVVAYFFAHGRDVLSEYLDDEPANVSDEEKRSVYNSNANMALFMFTAGVITLTMCFVRKAPWYRPAFTNLHPH